MDDQQKRRDRERQRKISPWMNVVSSQRQNQHTNRIGKVEGNTHPRTMSGSDIFRYWNIHENVKYRNHTNSTIKYNLTQRKRRIENSGSGSTQPDPPKQQQDINRRERGQQTGNHIQ